MSSIFDKYKNGEITYETVSVENIDASNACITDLYLGTIHLNSE